MTQRNRPLPDLAQQPSPEAEHSLYLDRLCSALDIESGLEDAPRRAEHSEFVDGLEEALDVEHGLRAALTAARGQATVPAQSSTEGKLIGIERITTVVKLLERGDWRAAMETLRSCGDLGEHEVMRTVLVSLRCVAQSMQLQCASGDVVRAAGELNRAAAGLVRLQRATPATRERWLTLFDEPNSARPVGHLVWVTTRLVLRERAELDALRLLFGDITRGGRELVYACVEHLTWVEFDPFTVRVHEHDQELLGLDDAAYRRFRTANPQDISARATKLRQFAAVRQGSVASQTWQRIGGYGSVREAALTVLAGEELTRGRTDLPVRLGRAYAVQYAKHWAKTFQPDLEANLV